MKKASFTTIYSVAFLFLSAAVTCASGRISFKSAWIPLIISFAMIIFSTVFAIVYSRFFCKRNFNNARRKIRMCVVSVLNSVAMGLAIRAWYIYRGLTNSLPTLILVALAASSVILFFYIISFIPFVDRHYSVFFWILSALLLAAFIVCIIAFRAPYLSTFGYYMIIVWCLSMSMCCGDGDENFYNNVLLSSFSVWIVALLILLFMLDSDGADLDLFELSFQSPKSPKNQRITD